MSMLADFDPSTASDTQAGAQPQTSYFAGPDAARRAVEMALPLITQAMTRPQEVGDSGFLHIVVMDPARSPADCSFDEAVLHEHSVGDRTRWDADYAAYARAKARLAWQHGMSTHALQALRPHVLRAGDTNLWGSAVLDGIVVGVSGALPFYDEAFAHVVAACLRAIAKQTAAATAGTLRLA
ncbi:hypothetical protein CO705_20580 [Ralstonia pickettii]|jgi:hypothetical protein|nr:hypothetical protein CO705_20580 [Ralstonia pickettii]CAJ0736816.1 hypothetical protein R76696_01337 [Ralstonia mannitolilytica]